jgi:hypothetical protein
LYYNRNNEWDRKIAWWRANQRERPQETRCERFVTFLSSPCK